MLVREARRRFFADSGLPADGGYEDPWATAEFGPLTYTVPNLRLRSEALRLHDLHHVVTGLPTHWLGEAEISAWELGSGAGRNPYAWFVALWGLCTGLLSSPSRMLRAFAWGRRSRNLYGTAYHDGLLEQPVKALRARLVGPREEPDLADLGLLGLWALPALALGLLSLPGAALLALVGELKPLVGQLVPCTANG